MFTITKVNNKKRLRSGVFIVKFEHISHLFIVFLMLTLNNLVFGGYPKKHVRTISSVPCLPQINWGRLRKLTQCHLEVFYRKAMVKNFAKFSGKRR